MSKGFGIKRQPGKQRGVTYVLLFWSMFSLIVVGAFFQEGIAFFSDHPTQFMNDAEYFVTLGVVILATVAFMMLVHRNFRIPVHWGWAIAFFLLFACDVVAVYLLPWHVEGVSEVAKGTIHYSYDFGAIERLRYVISFGVSCFYFYLYFAVFPKIFHNIRRLHLFFYVALLTALVAIVYSLIAEWSLYATMFQPDVEWRVNEVVSFTNNPNTFAFILLLAMFATFILHNRRSHWWWIVVLFFLGIFQLLIGSGSGCLASWLLIVAFVIYRFCVTLKYYTGRALLFFFLFWAGAVTFAVLIFAEVGGPSSLFARVGHVLKAAQFSQESGALRIVTWNRIMNLLSSPLEKIFGVGAGQSLTYLGRAEGAELPDGTPCIYYAHSGFMQQIMDGGFLRLGFYLLLIARFVYLCIKGLKRKTRIAWPCLICMGALMVRSCFESTSFLSAETKGVSVFLLLVLPVEVDEFLATHPELKGYESQALGDRARFVFRFDYSPLRMAKLALLFLTPFVAVGLGALPHLFRAGYLTQLSGWAYYALFVAIFLLVPFGFYCIGHHAEREDRAIFGGLLGAGYGIAFTVGLVAYAFTPIVTYVCLGVLMLLTLIAYLCHARSVAHFREPLFLHAYLPHILICGTLIGLGCLGYLIPASLGSVYTPIMMSVALLILYVTAIYSPYGEELAYPLDVKLQRFDCARTARGIPKEEELQQKQEFYLKAGHVGPVGKGKTYIHRF